MELRVPRLRTLPFETQIIERYKTKQSSVEEALVERYLAGVSVRRVEDITEALWGAKVSSSTVSELNQKIYGKIEEWRKQPITGEHPYVFVDGVYLKRSWGGEVQNVSQTKNLVICVSGVGVTKDFSVIITDMIPDLELIGKSQCFPTAAITGRREFPKLRNA